MLQGNDAKLLGQKILAYLYFSAAAIFVFLVADFIGKKALSENFLVLLAFFMALTMAIAVLFYKELNVKK